MIDSETTKKFLIIALISVLLVLSFFIIRPVLTSTLAGLLLAYIFYPIFKKLYKWTKMKNLSAFLICFSILLIIFLLLWFFTPLIAKQVFDFYTSIQKLNIAESLQKTFPKIFTPELTSQFATSLNSFVTRATSYLLNSFVDYLTNFVSISLQFLLVLFVFFFTMRDGEKFVQSLREVSPLDEKHEKKFVNQFKAMTDSFIYGQLIVGTAQGIATGIGFFVFGVPHALILTVLAIIIGVLQIIGPTIMWVPMGFYYLFMGNTFTGLGLLIYGFGFLFWIDSLLKPIIISKMTSIHPAIVFVGMIGGLFVFGIMGLILGPLVFSYLLIILDIYKERKSLVRQDFTK